MAVAKFDIADGMLVRRCALLSIVLVIPPTVVRRDQRTAIWKGNQLNPVAILVAAGRRKIEGVEDRVMWTCNLLRGIGSKDE
jgi:hypothetical protein